MKINFVSSGILPLSKLPLGADVSATWRVEIRGIDPRDMKCRYKLTPKGLGTKEVPGHVVQPTQRTRFDLDLFKITQDKNSFVKVELHLIDAYAAFFHGPLTVSAGSEGARSIMYVTDPQKNGAYVDDNNAEFYCRATGEHGATLLPFNIGIVALDSNGDGTYSIPTFYDPKIKNDG